MATKPQNTQITPLPGQGVLFPDAVPMPETVTAPKNYVSSEDLSHQYPVYISNAVEVEGQFGPCVEITVWFKNPGEAEYHQYQWTPASSIERVTLANLYKSEPGRVYGPVKIEPVSTRGGKEYYRIANGTEADVPF